MPERELAPGKVHIYAVIRLDEYAAGEDRITVKEVLPTAEEADREVARLNRLAKQRGLTQTRYFWQTTRFFPHGRQIA